MLRAPDYQIFLTGGEAHDRPVVERSIRTAFEWCAATSVMSGSCRRPPGKNRRGVRTVPVRQRKEVRRLPFSRFAVEWNRADETLLSIWTAEEGLMNSIIYIVGLIVVIGVILSFFGLR